MRYAISCGVLLCAALNGFADDNPLAGKKGFVVHEWGVFRVHDDEEVANANARAGWDAMPDFVYGNIQGRGVPQHWGVREVVKQPILFFHATETVQARVKVEFPNGMPGLWWPATHSPAVLGNAKPPPVGIPLEWNLAVKRAPNGWVPRAQKEVPQGHWFEQARAVRCDTVFSRYSPNPTDVEQEKFLYYDAIFPQGKWVAIAVDKDAVTLTNRVKHPVFEVTVVDRRTDGKVRVGRLDKLDLRDSVVVKFTDADVAKFPAEASAALVKQLVAAGLFTDEAQLLADCWKHDFFERPGLHVFYRIPEDEYDQRLPLTITPTPEKVVRTGLVYHGNVEPDLADRVAALVKKLDADEFKVREAGEEKLRAIGPAAMPHLAKIRKTVDLSAEAKKRVDGILKDWSAKSAF